MPASLTALITAHPCFPSQPQPSTIAHLSPSPPPPLPLCPAPARPHRHVLARSAVIKKAKIVATPDLTEKRKTPTTTSATDFATGKKRCFKMCLQMRAATRKAKKAKKGKKGKKAKERRAQGSE